jgi:hypothetical protein
VPDSWPSSLGHVARSGLRGAAAGAVLAMAYTVLVIPLAGLSLVASNLPGGKGLDALIGAGAFAICAFPFALVLGVLPGVLLGAIGGLLIGAATAPFRGRLQRRAAAGIGLAVAGLMVFAAHLAIAPDLLDSARQGLGRYVPYLFWVAGPSLLTFLGLGWAGWSAGSTR